MTSGELTNFWKEESGQDMVEYSLLIAFLALVAVGALSGINTTVTGILTTLNSTLSTAAS
jgi:Flp pilus assembly pilin Flp